MGGPPASTSPHLMRESRSPIMLKPVDLHQAPSVISSRMTDVASEDCDAYHLGGEEAQHSTEQTDLWGTIHRGPTHQERRAQVSSAQRGILGSNAPVGQKAVNTFGVPGTTMSSTSRPPSANGRTGRTHVPAIASHAFLRPMSSQKLQAQRGAKHFNSRQAAIANRNFASDNDRNSLGSNPKPISEQQGHKSSSPSRGTEFTEHESQDRMSTSVNSRGNAIAPSAENSTRPLPNLDSLYEQSPHLPGDHCANHHLNIGPHVPKTTGSFRSSFLLPTSRKASPPPRTETDHHQRLSSAAVSPQILHEKSQSKTLSEMKVSAAKNHEFFLGNTIFCWGGRLQNTRDRPVNVATGILVVLPATLFFVYSAPYYWKNISPAIPIVFAYIFFVCVSSLIHASFSDPGILPRNLHVQPLSQSHEDPLSLGPIMHDWALTKPPNSSSPTVEVSIKYCKSCNIWRSLRCHHCRVCDNCVETQDHHCVWLNNCVGRRNYRYFFSFVSSGTLLGLILTVASLGHCLHYQFKDDLSFNEAINSWRVTFAMFIYGILVTPYPACLMAYHLFLMGRGETTREYLNSHKIMRSERTQPFDQGSVIQNWIAVLLRPRPPTYLGLKHPYTEGDQGLGPRRYTRRLSILQYQHSGEVEMQRVRTGGF